MKFSFKFEFRVGRTHPRFLLPEGIEIREIGSETAQQQAVIGFQPNDPEEGEYDRKRGN